MAFSVISQIAPTRTELLELLSPYKSELSALMFDDFDELLTHYESQKLSVDQFREQSRFILEHIWEKLHTGHWKDVPLCWRTIYAAVRVVRALYIVSRLKPPFLSDKSSVYLHYALEDLDYSLLMGYPIFDGVAAKLATAIHKLMPVVPINVQLSDEKVSVTSSMEGLPPAYAKLTPLNRIFRPSLEKFLDLMRVGQPFILTGSMAHWPACRSGDPHAWTVNYWRQSFGHRTVPIEIGRRYTDESWGQELMPINRFIDQFVTQTLSSGNSKSEAVFDRPIGYLAQHQLFLQIPELADDVYTPDYCMVNGKESSKVSDVDINVWFGPANTVSPLHHDSDRSNLLAQINGHKYVVLFTASETPLVYPHSEKMLCNTSQVDVEHPNLEKYPRFALARGFHGVLSPGEMVFIPPRCWHYVRSLTTSFSVNFWWNVASCLIPPWPSD